MTTTDILKALNRHKMTQKDLSRLTGIHTSTLCNFLSGRAELSVDFQRKIELVLNDKAEYSQLDLLRLHNEYQEYCKKMVPSFAGWLESRGGVF